MSDEKIPMPPVVSVDEPQEIAGVRMVRFAASAFVDNSDLVQIAALERMVEWVREHPDAALIHAEFSGFDDTARIGRERGMVAAVMESSFTSTVSLFYEGMSDEPMVTP